MVYVSVGQDHVRDFFRLYSGLLYSLGQDAARQSCVDEYGFAAGS